MKSMSLRVKFMLAIFFLEFVLMLPIILVVEHQMRSSIMEEFLKRGLSIGRNLAAVNSSYVATYNYVNIEQNVTQVTKENGLLYAVVFFHDGELAAWAGSASLKEQVLEGPLHAQTIKAEKEIIQYGHVGDSELCDIAVPVFFSDENWGTVRCGFSLETIQTAIHNTRLLLLSMGGVGLLLGYLASSLLARRITRPVAALVNSVEAVSQGDYDHEIVVTTHDEIAYLGRRFATMKDALKHHISMLVKKNEEVTEANRRMEAEIRQRKRTEVALRTAKKAAEAASTAKTHFLNNISHELRTPMNVILGSIELMMGTHLSQKQQNLTRTVFQSLNGLLCVIDSILDFSRLELDEIELETTDFNLRETMEEIMGFLFGEANQKGLELLCRIGNDVPELVRGDSKRLHQLMRIIVGNAIKFTEKGEVFVRVEAESMTDQTVVIRVDVTDTGIGISPEHLDMIFNVFSQADTSLTRQYEGLGLGLATAHILIDKMGGEIDVMSEPGSGSTFRFTVALGRQPFVLESGDRAQLLSHLNVLVVSGNETARLVACHYLSGWGIHSEESVSGAHAFEQLGQAASRGKSYHAALIDYTLPDMEGTSLARRIRSRPSSSHVVPVLMIPPGVNPEERSGKLPGSAVLLIKPLRRSMLYKALVSFSGPLVPPPDLQPDEEGGLKVPYRFDSHVLLVDDNPLNLMLAHEKLKILGCSVDEARNGKEAVEKFEDAEYDMIAMDCQMPVMDGYESARVIREKESRSGSGESHIPILAITAHAMEGDLELCLDAGMDDYLTKPFTLKQLGDMMSRWLDSKTGSSPLSLESGGDGQGAVYDLKKERGQPAADSCLPPLEASHLSVREQPVDWDTMDKIMGGKTALKKVVISMFLKDSLTHVEKLSNYGNSANTMYIKNTAHAFKSNSANVGALTLSKLCSDLEKAAAKNDVNEFPLIISNIKTECDRVREVLQEGLEQLE